MAMTVKALENYMDKKYRYPLPTAKDVHKLISHYNDLRPIMSQYVFPDGSSRELLSLSGTIPIIYKGNTYNIPVEIWVMDTHPHNPPLCYVKPTADMKIKQNRHVDQNGRVYLPYLTDWNHTKSDLLECCQIMAMQFGEAPPVYSRKATPGNAVSPPHNYVSGNASPGPGPGGYQMPMPPTNMGPGSGPAYPAYPPVGGPVYPQQAYPSYPAAGRIPGDSNQAYPAGAYNPPSRSSYPPYMPANNSGPAYPAPGNPYPSGYPSTDNKTNTITDEHIRASLLSAVEEKLGRRLNEIVQQAQSEVSSLSRTHDDLERGRRTLDEIFERLDKEQRTVDKNIALLTEKVSDLRTAVNSISEKEGIDVDEAVVPTAPLYKQLLNAYAEECALEDAVYYMGEALRRNVIDLDVFLKHMRELSRKQFIQRALIQKCRDRAGLP